MDSYIKNKLDEIYNKVKENCSSVYLVGSTVLDSYISKAKDFDILFIYTDLESSRKARKILKENFNLAELKTEFKLDIIQVPIDKNITIYSDAHRFRKLLYGEETIEPAVSILENKDEFKKILKIGIDKFKKRERSYYQIKDFYYYYYIYCVIYNNSYDLTEEQINNTNILHDRKEEDFQIRKQLIDNLIKEISLWQMN